MAEAIKIDLFYFQTIQMNKFIKHYKRHPYQHLMHIHNTLKFISECTEVIYKKFTEPICSLITTSIHIQKRDINSTYNKPKKCNELLSIFYILDNSYRSIMNINIWNPIFDTCISTSNSKAPLTTSTYNQFVQWVFNHGV